jgi:hypothetical protein
MVPLVAVADEFTGRVLVAKLGSAGILAEVRGVGGPYPPLASAEVWVEETGIFDAQELITSGADVFPVFDAEPIDPDDLDDPRHPDDRPPDRDGRPRRAPAAPRRHQRRLFRAVLAAVALLLLASISFPPRCGPAPSVQAH